MLFRSIKQAKNYGFDENRYLDALSKVPVVSEEKVKAAMDFLHEMTQFISEQAYQKKELFDLSKQLVESEAKFKSVFESANVGKSITLTTGEINVNQAFCDMLGYTPEELQNKKWQDLTPEDEIPAIQALTEPLIKGERDSARFEKRYICKNKSTIWADVSITIQRNGNGIPLHFITTVIDITERKWAEESKRINEERFRVAQEMSPDGFTILHPVRNEKGEVVDFTWVYENQAVARINGTNPKDVIGKQLLDLFPSHRGTDVFDAYLDVANTRETCILEEVYAGEILSKPTWLRMVIVSMGEEIAILANDITERRQLELERQKFFLLAESSSDFIGMCDLNMQPLYVNPAGRRMVGLPDMKAACSVKVQDYYFPEDQKFIAEEFFPRVLQNGHGDVEIRLRHFQTEEAIWMYYYLYKVCDARGKAIGWATVSRDISERRQAENKLIESEKRYRSLFENMNAGFVLFEVVRNEQGTPVDLIIVAANEGFEKTTGLILKAAVGKHLTKVLPGIEKDEADWIGKYSQVALTGEPIHFEQGSELLGHYYSISAFQAAPKQCAVSFLDITERKRNEEVIIESEKKYRLLFESNPQPMWVYDIETLSFLAVNDAAVLKYGYSKEEFLRMTIKDIRPHEDVSKLLQNVKSLSSGMNDAGVWRHCKKNGSLIFVEITSYVIDFEGRKAELVLSIDITDRIKANEKLIESEARFRKIFEDGATGMVLVGKDFKFRMANLTFCQMTGYTEDELLQLTFVQITHPDDIAKDIQNVKKLTEGKIDVYKSEKRYLKKDGQTFWAQLTVSSIYDSEGGFLYNVAIIVDITERKQIEEDLIRMSRIMKNSQEIAHLGSFEYVAATQTTIWSEEEYHIYGLDPNGPSPEYNVMLEKCIHPDDAKLLHETFMAAMQNRGVYELEHRIVRPDESVRWVYDKAHPYFDENGNLLRYVGATLDITERKRVEEEIKQLNAELELKVEQRTSQLEATNKELEAFSYSVSHDLRAPLRHINGYVEMLNEKYHKALDDKARHYLDTITSASRQMGILIDDLLKFSRTGRKELSSTELDLNKMIQEIMKELNPVMEGRKIEWDIQELPKVFGDYTLLKLVWTNLLDNAVKYTRNQPLAKISVGYKIEAKNFVFCVRDNGVGFDMKYVHKLFGVFQRLHSQSEFEGTGIGLANVQRIIFKHNGQVWAEAEPGKGASFYFSLPKSERE